jgi:hypothetical protein
VIVRDVRFVVRLQEREEPWRGSAGAFILSSTSNSAQITRLTHELLALSPHSALNTPIAALACIALQGC